MSEDYTLKEIHCAVSMSRSRGRFVVSRKNQQSYEYTAQFLEDSIARDQELGDCGGPAVLR
jgi:hypothetical protein